MTLIDVQQKFVPVSRSKGKRNDSEVGRRAADRTVVRYETSKISWGKTMSTFLDE